MIEKFVNLIFEVRAKFKLKVVNNKAKRVLHINFMPWKSISQALM